MHRKNQMWLKYSLDLTLWNTWRQSVWLELEIRSSLLIVEQSNLAKENNDGEAEHESEFKADSDDVAFIVHVV